MLTKNATQNFLAQHDFVYEKPPQGWHQGVPLSNARMAAMLWGDGRPLILTLDRYDLWDLRQKPVDWSTYNYANMKKLLAEARATGDGRKVYEVFGRDFETDWYHKAIKQTRLMPGRIEIELGSETTGMDMRLDLFAAQVAGKIATKTGGADFRCFIDAQRDVIVAEVNARGGEKIRRIDTRATKADFSQLGYPDPESGKTRDIHWRIQRQTEGGEFTVAWTVAKAPKGDRQTLYCTIANSREQGGTIAEAIAKVEEAVALGVGKLFKEHAEWWAEYWTKSFVTIPDSHIENLYYAQLYYLACLSREGAGFGQGCLGIWNMDDARPGWNNQHCYDMNYQMSSWLTFPSNHLEMATPMAEDLWRWHPGRKEFCEKFYGCDGATLNSGVDFDGWNVPGWFCPDLWPGCGPWACHTIWNIYQYSRDKEFLRHRAYPLMKDYMGQYVGMLEKWDDGKYHVPASSSPEWQNNEAAAWDSDDSGNLALIRWLGAALLEAEKILGMRSEISEKWRDILENIAPFHEDNSGLLIMKDKPLDQTHRHHTHLLALYPLGIINIEGDAADRNLIDRSLGNIVHRGMGAWCGYSIAWMSAMSARTGRPKRAQALLKLFADIATGEIGYHVNADTYQKGFMSSGAIILTPEGGLAAAAALLEMLIQSWGGVIRIFPATAPQWADAAFDRLRAEGAFLVSARRKKGKTTWVQIESEAGGECRVRNPFAGDAGRPSANNPNAGRQDGGGEIDGDQGVGRHRGRGQVAVMLRDETTGKERKLTGETITFATKIGGVYTLTNANASGASSALPAFRRDASATNWYGVKEIPRF